jgi:hypothetical protein
LKSGCGRRPKARAEAQQVVHLVFAHLYGLTDDQQRGHAPEIVRRLPGTMDAHRFDHGPLPEPVCTLEEACKALEPTLKHHQLHCWVNAETGEIGRYREAPLIARRRSEGVGQEGDALRQAVYRELKKERASLRRVGMWPRMRAIKS